MFFNILQHPITAHIILVSASNTEQSTMIRHYSPTELGNIVIEINQVFRLFVCLYIVEVNVLVTPFEVVNYALVSQFLLHYEYILEEVNYSLLYVKVVELSYHRLLVL
jgi:hypothetical protein